MDKEKPKNLADIGGRQAVVDRVASECFGEKIKSGGLTEFISEHHEGFHVDNSQKAQYGLVGEQALGEFYMLHNGYNDKGEPKHGSFPIPMLRPNKQNPENPSIDHDDWYVIGVAPPKDGDWFDINKFQYVVAKTNPGSPKIEDYELVDIAETEALRLILAEGETAAQLTTEVADDIANIAPRAETIASAEIRLSPENIAVAEQEIAKIIGEKGQEMSSLGTYLRKLGSNAAEIRAALDPNRGDINLPKRDHVVRLIRRAIDELGGGGKLPERVQNNSNDNLKSPSIPKELKSLYPEDKYSSREYASMLGLAMLDGTYTPPNERELELRKQDLVAEGETRDGQHRRAAEMALAELGAKEAKIEEEFANNEALARVQKELMQLNDSTEVGQLRKYIDWLDNIAQDLARDRVNDYSELQQGSARLKNEIIVDISNQLDSLRQQLTQIQESDLAQRDGGEDLMTQRRDQDIYEQLKSFLSSNLTMLDGLNSNRALNELARGDYLYDQNKVINVNQTEMQWILNDLQGFLVRLRNLTEQR
jgi:hypothetical protein